MFAYLLRPIRHFAQALVSHDSPRQVAWGCVLGMGFGLIPKGNLLAVSLGALLCGLRVSKPAGVMSAGLFSLVGLWLDPLAHKLGATALFWEPLRSVHACLYQSGLSPWLGLNNTVVVGHVLIALYLSYPVHWMASRFVARFQARLGRWLLQYRAIRWLRGAEIGTQWGIET